MNKLKEYYEILKKLPIDNPTQEDMASVCPHLTKEQAVEAFSKDGSYVACPSLRIKGAFQVISFYKEHDERPPRLYSSYASRTLRSYADNHPHGDIFSEYRYMEEAMKYAEENWGDELILDTWVDALEVYVQDPSDLVDRGWRSKQPKTKQVLYVTLNRELNEVINDHSEPESELFDKAIAEMTIDELIWQELKGGRGIFTEFNCAYCGSGLGLAGCSGCGYKFDDDGWRCGWSTPLSKKMVEFLRQNGLVFKKDPQIAWDKEKARHEEYKKAVAEREAEKELESRKQKNSRSLIG